MSHDVLLVLVTVPAHESVELGQTLVEEQLVACVNIIRGLTSIYRWQGNVQQDAEVLLLMKTTDGNLDRLTQRVLELHSYDTPEVLAIPVVGGSAPYIDWLRQQVMSKEAP